MTGYFGANCDGVQHQEAVAAEQQSNACLGRSSKYPVGNSGTGVVETFFVISIHAGWLNWPRSIGDETNQHRHGHGQSPWMT